MRTRAIWLTLAVAMFVAIGATPAFANLSGAISATMFDGSRVASNVFSTKFDVFLSGGAGPNAPAAAQGLTEGWYVYQVTDPTGRTLLSPGPVGNRRFHANSHGFIDDVKGLNPCPDGVSCEPLTGNYTVEVDGQSFTALTVHLGGYGNTPDPGGVYKVWAMLESDFLAANGGESALALSDPPAHVHGFIPTKSKMESFKVGGNAEQRLKVQQFCDANANGSWDAGESEISSWPIKIVGPNSATYDPVFTKVDMISQASGTWSISQAEAPLGDTRSWKVTALRVDAAAKTANRQTAVRNAGRTGEEHTVVFGNVPLGTIVAHKFHDKNCNQVQDAGEQDVSGFRFQLRGTSGAAAGFQRTATSNANGLANFEGLLPGTYVLTEQPRDGWLATTPTQKQIVLRTWSDGDTDPVVVTEEFGDVRSVTIVASKFLDANADGEWDSGERPVANWAFLLSGTDSLGNDVSIPGFTDAKGKIRWAEAAKLYPGDYVVREVPRSDTELIVATGLWYRVDSGPEVRVAPALTLDVPPQAGQEWSVGFGSCAPGAIDAVVLQDGNADGIGDTPRQGWNVTLNGTTGRGEIVSLSGTTDSDGRITWAGLCPGSYRVEPDLVAGWRPMGGASTTVGLTSGEAEHRTSAFCQETSFTVRELKDLNGNGFLELGEPKLAGIVVHLWGGPAGNRVDRRLETDAEGCALFDHLLPGTYYVEQVLPRAQAWKPSAMYFDSGDGLGFRLGASSTAQQFSLTSNAVGQTAYFNSRPGHVRRPAVLGRQHERHEGRRRGMAQRLRGPAHRHGGLRRKR